MASRHLPSRHQSLSLGEPEGWEGGRERRGEEEDGEGEEEDGRRREERKGEGIGGWRGKRQRRREEEGKGGG